MTNASLLHPVKFMLTRLTLVALLTATLVIVGCDDASPPPTAISSTSTPSATANQGSQKTETEARPIRIVFLGDSITAGMGLASDQAYPALLEKQLNGNGMRVSVVNAGVSGDTTAGGLRRTDWLLKQSPDILVVALGGNDGLRVQDISQSKANLKAIIQKAQDANTRVLLLGMNMPPNLGSDYTQQFKAMYDDLAKEMNVPLMPFLLQDVGGHPDLNQPDGIHPTAQGQAIIASNVLPFIVKMIHDLPERKNP